MAKAIQNNRLDHWQGAEKVNIWSASTTSVIPDERRFAGRDPESSESDELRQNLWGERGHAVILRS
jgi:hypothetical protein